MDYPLKNPLRHIVVLLLTTCCLFPATAAQEKFFELFPEPSAKGASSQAFKNTVSYPIQINRAISELSVGDVIEFPVSANKSLQLQIDGKWSAGNGDVQMTAKFDESGSAVITLGSNSVFADISSKEIRYGISVDENQRPFLIDHNASQHRIDLGDDMRIPDGVATVPDKNSLPLVARKATADNKSIITLLAIYSPQFAGGFANPETRINQMIAFTNRAYERSGIFIELQLVKAEQVAFNNGADIGSLLDQVTNGTGAFNRVHALRDRFFADMVAVLPFNARGSVAGVAWVNGDRARNSYSVSQFAPWGSDSVFAHELGHNLGSGHERRSANPSQRSPCTGGFTGYACGHGNGTQGTLMSYLNDAAWNSVFSNPTLDCNGEPCGIPQGRSNSADNKTSFNISAPLIEAFRIDTTNDDDKDGVKNNVDNCRSVANPTQLDTDSDGRGDACDNDDDGDGVNDVDDNCPLTANALQADADKNGQGDACQKDDFCFPVKRNNKVMLICL